MIREAPASSLWRPVASALRAPATWTFAAAWVATAAVLAVLGDLMVVLQSLPQTLIVVLLSWVTVLMTSEARAPDAALGRPRWQPACQLAGLLVIALLTGVIGMVGNHALPGALAGIGSRTMQTFRLGPHILGVPAPLIVLNPVTDVVIPLVVLLLLGARPRDLGLGPGHRVWRVMALWCVLPLVAVLVLIGLGMTTPMSRATAFVRNFFENGFSEEFLWRGAILTRLSRLVSPAWALVLSALGFGLWHVGADASVVHGNLLASACAGIVSQGPFGLGIGVVFQRTRNLAAGTVVHMLYDTLSF